MEVRTQLYEGQWQEWEALASDPDRLQPHLDAFLESRDVTPEEHGRLRSLIERALEEENGYQGLTDREARLVDRAVCWVWTHALSLSALGRPYYAYRYDWVLGFIEREPAFSALEPLWDRLAHGRRLDPRAQPPENVPYYAWLNRPEVEQLQEALPSLARSLAAAPRRSLLARRGTADPAATRLVEELVPILDPCNGDILIVTQTQWP